MPAIPDPLTVSISIDDSDTTWRSVAVVPRNEVWLLYRLTVSNVGSGSATGQAMVVKDDENPVTEGCLIYDGAAVNADDLDRQVWTDNPEILTEGETLLVKSTTGDGHTFRFSGQVARAI